MFKGRLIFLILIINIFITGCAIEPQKTVPEKYKLGQKIFHIVCAGCHGRDALGGNKAPTSLQAKFHPSNFANGKFARVILNGSNSGSMPSQKRKVTDQDIREIIQYIRYSQKQAGINP
jgi:mono/diheme cytochrome c family protein